VIVAARNNPPVFPAGTAFTAPYSRTDFHVARVGVNFKLY
jgi:hypothetical protein